ncbi:hypothetical protein MMC11_002786 [Xylographa trunciseda]|nr:hypothetical protein [Xylographa trunciseda]
MCFRSMKGDLQDNPTEQPIRIVGSDSPPVAPGTRTADSEHFPGASRDGQDSNSHDAITGIGPDVEQATAHAPAPKKDKKKSKGDKPSWKDLFRVDGPPLQSYQRDVNGKKTEREAAQAKALQGRLDDESFQREMKKKGGVDWGGGGVW